MRLDLHQRELHQFISSLSVRSRAVLLLTIFCLFATFGFVSDVVSVGRHPAARIAVDVALSGVMAILYSFVGTRSAGALVGVGAVQVTVTVLLATWSPIFLADAPIRAGTELARRLGFDALGITMGVMIGYSALTQLLTREGSRYLRMRTEMRLAENIHRGLVPALTGRHPGLEFAGASYPSGEVGGDLVDAVSCNDGRWIGYIADVSGHGVQAGVVMAMVKSAIRMALARGASVDTILEQTNEVLVPLMTPNMFVTAAVAQVDRTGVRIALAGHLPILHYQKTSQTVEEGYILNFPLGFFAGHQYTTTRLMCAPGDVLLIITDGLTDVFDKKDREFGLGAVKHVLARVGSQRVDQILASIVAAARDHGSQLDDQTALVVRFTG
jgi:serine phosphatase RsbU (regulator of sigma subunit)